MTDGSQDPNRPGERTREAHELPREHPSPDNELVTRIIAGDKPLYAVLMRRHNQRLFRVVRAIVGRDDEAEDVVHEAYVTAYRNLAQFRAEASFGTWLTRIAINEAKHRLRRDKRHAFLTVVQEGGRRAMGSPAPAPEDETYRRELATILEEHVDALPEALRVVFMMRDVEELNTAETAAALDITEEAVRVRLHRARHTLQDRLSRVLEAAPEAFRFAGARCDRIVARVASTLRLTGEPQSNQPS